METIAPAQGRSSVDEQQVSRPEQSHTTCPGTAKCSLIMCVCVCVCVGVCARHSLCLWDAAPKFFLCLCDIGPGTEASLFGGPLSVHRFLPPLRIFLFGAFVATSSAEHLRTVCGQFASAGGIGRHPQEAAQCPGRSPCPTPDNVKPEALPDPTPALPPRTTPVWHSACALIAAGPAPLPVHASPRPGGGRRRADPVPHSTAP